MLGASPAQKDFYRIEKGFAMQRKSSFHYGKGNLGFCAHNDRSKPTANSIFSTKNNEYSCSAKEAIEIYRQELQKRTLAYTMRRNKKLHKNTITHLSAIINLDERHTLQDVQKFADYLEEILGTKVFQIAVHKDEGYVDEETGKKHINYHAHIEFLGLDEQGNSVRRKLDKSMLSHLQDKVAEILQMERGINYTAERKKRPKRLDTYEYKEHAKRLAKALKPYDKAILNAYLQYKLQNAKDPRAYKDFILQKLAERDESFVKEYEAYKEYITQTDPQNFVRQEAENIAKIKDLKEENKKLREQLKEAGAKREQYAQLEQFVKEIKEQVKAKELTIAQLKEQMQSMQEQLLKQLREKDRQIAQLQEKNKALQKQVTALQNAPAPEPQVIVKEDTAKIERLQKELEEEKAKNAKLVGLLKKQEEEIERLKRQLQELKQLRYRERKEREEEIRQLKEALKGAKKELAEYQNEDFLAKMRTGELVQRWRELVQQVDDHFHDLSDAEFQKIQSEIDQIEEELKKYGIGLHAEQPPKAPKKSRNYGRGMGF